MNNRWMKLCALGAALSGGCPDGGGGDGGGGDVDMATLGLARDLTANPADLTTTPPDLFPDLAPALRRITGLKDPQSVYYHAASRQWFVANSALPASGKRQEKDGQGWISRLDGDGKLLEERWVSGLDNPTVIRSFNNQLVITDVDQLVLINTTDKAVRKIAVAPAAGGGVLWGLAVQVATGQVTVADAAKNALYGGSLMDAAPTFTQSLQDARLNAPTSVLLFGGGPTGETYLGSGGDPAGPEGKLLRYSTMMGGLTETMVSGRITSVQLFNNATLWLADNSSRQVLSTPRPITGMTTVLRDLKNDGFQSVGDIGVDVERRLIGVPDPRAGAVGFFELATAM